VGGPGCSTTGGRFSTFIYTTSMPSKKQVRLQLIQAPACRVKSSAAVRDIRESSGKWLLSKPNRRSCGVARVREGDQDGPGLTYNHKAITGLPNAANRRLNRRRMGKPFSGSHCPVPVGNWALSFLHTVCSHVTIGVACVRCKVYYTRLKDRPSGSCNHFYSSSCRPSKTTILGVFSGGSRGAKRGDGVRRELSYRTSAHRIVYI
jgi:hypothetical protein